MKLSTYYTACLKAAEKRAVNPNVRAVDRAGAKIEIESLKEQLAKIESGEVQDEEI
ncbi:MAG: hypothetical protein J6S92_05450 [Oscillospiraceae bacterium]|nr:hypothetical protein [Bacteroidaceae bacterium]MBP0987706.1 hypothetical protein [Oscillospiraceae bacterium]